jgi:hypothetical protein
MLELDITQIQQTNLVAPNVCKQHLAQHLGILALQQFLAKTINWRGQISENVKPWDMFNGTPRATTEEAERRFNICKSCPELVELTSTCKKCGCFMYMKTKLEPATCPLGKW